MTDKPPGPPANIVEFNSIAGRVFAQLYESFPSPVGRLNDSAIAMAMKVSSGVLPSGRKFDDVVRHSVGWLADEGYIRAGGLTPYDGVILTQKGLAALNAVPQGLSASVGTSLVMATGGSGQNWSGMGDLVGGIIGGFTKTITGS
jgi:hypothetical protein